MEPKNILLVEDDPTLSLLVADVLRHAGYRPITIAHHSEIPSALEQWQPQCVILDGEVRSTGESRTWDDAASIRRSHPTVPVVIFTGDGAALAEARAARSSRSRTASFAGVIAKPFALDEFLATIRSAVQNGAPDDEVGVIPPARPPESAISVFPDLGRLAADWPEADLFGTIVHELRGPLTVIRGQVQLARRRMGRDPERERAALDSAMEQVDRMGELITELLDQARLTSNSLTLNIVLFDLVTAVADAVAIHDYAPVPRIRFLRPLGRVAVHGDPDRVAQIIDNLIGNALKYSADDAPVEVSLMLNGAMVEVRVADHGIGVPVMERDRLFTPFFRTSISRHIRGTGLGLHISKRLAERHGGDLRLESSSDAGSTFVLTLPAPAAA